MYAQSEEFDGSASGATETIVGLTDDFVATPGFAGLFTHRPQKRANVRLVVNS